MFERRARLNVCVHMWGVVGDMRGTHTHTHTHTHNGGGAAALKGLRTKRRARGGDREENAREESSRCSRFTLKNNSINTNLSLRN